MNHVEIKSMPNISYSQEESINSLATNLSYCGSDIKSIMVTSRTASEGKSFVAINMLRTFASLGKRVCLLDTDLRRSVMTSRFKVSVPKGIGLSHYLAGVCELEDAICDTNIENGCIVPCGRTVENSLQLLASSRMKPLIDELTSRFDIVIVDTAPAGVISDALEIGKYCDGAVIVVGYNVGHTKEVVKLADDIQRTGCNVLGVALNQVEMNRISNRHYYYGYGKYDRYYKSYRKEDSSANGAKKKKKK